MLVAFYLSKAFHAVDHGVLLRDILLSPLPASTKRLRWSRSGWQKAQQWRWSLWLAQ